MKTGVKFIGAIIAFLWGIISVPFLVVLWFLGGTDVFENFIDAIEYIFDN